MHPYLRLFRARTSNLPTRSTKRSLQYEAPFSGGSRAYQHFEIILTPSLMTCNSNAYVALR